MGKWATIAVAAILLALVAALFAAPRLVETAWARERISRAIEEATGRRAELGAITFSWWEGLAVRELTVHQRDNASERHGPLLRTKSVELDVDFRDLLRRRLTIERFHVESPEVVAIRERDGTYNFSDLMTRPPSDTPPPELDAQLGARDGAVLFVDRASNTSFRVDDFNLDGIVRDGRATIDARFELQDGPGTLRAKVGFAESPATFTIDELVVRDASLDENLSALSIFVPLIGLRADELSGKLDLELRDVTGRGLDRHALLSTLRGHGRIELRAGAVLGGPVGAITRALEAALTGQLRREATGLAAEALGRAPGGAPLSFEVVSSRFTIGDGRVRTRELVVRGPGVTLELEGSTTFAGTLDYRVTPVGLAELVAERLPEDAPRELVGLAEHLRLLLTGSLATPRASANLRDALEETASNEVRARAEALRERAEEKGRGAAEREKEKLRQRAKEKGLSLPF